MDQRVDVGGDDIGIDALAKLLGSVLGDVGDADEAGRGIGRDEVGAKRPHASRADDRNADFLACHAVLPFLFFVRTLRPCAGHAKSRIFKPRMLSRGRMSLDSAHLRSYHVRT